MSLKCIIVDDEKPARKLIQAYCDRLEGVDVIGDFRSPINCMDTLINESVDLIFLDINMPEITGLEFLKTLKNPPHVIITTAYRQYAVEGFELNVADYLVKPIEFNRFVMAVNKVKELNALKQIKDSTITPTIETFPSLTLKSDRKIYKVKINDILFVKADGEYVVYQTRTFGPLKVYDALKRVEDSLASQGFCRIHRSYLVNLSEIKYIDSSRLFIGEFNLPISDRYRNELIDAMGGES
ncbi:LytR/AlgR family response regulator transcription factor [Aureibacter tunicatorum]|uniref:DNA-binding LytR/AlgR family response regulator n=1 Tax=Aureibacter tunicatorum TaxID=866807 RepID=A0AAE3XQM0_9BACT|nr:LytTR family DNA-binding domain-containing protein [Aureibacter tunicatorum]MDR6240802.1 DNA-binding LytR/AlgR family response regulator [Aureibacter tunicatorum]BDD06865.1 DNA-binding response regulator [Aureibacter tunicatorum]